MTPHTAPNHPILYDMAMYTLGNEPALMRTHPYRGKRRWHRELLALVLMPISDRWQLGRKDGTILLQNLKFFVVLLFLGRLAEKTEAVNYRTSNSSWLYCFLAAWQKRLKHLSTDLPNLGDSTFSRAGQDKGVVMTGGLRRTLNGGRDVVIEM